MPKRRKLRCVICGAVHFKERCPYSAVRYELMDRRY